MDQVKYIIKGKLEEYPDKWLRYCFSINVMEPVLKEGGILTFTQWVHVAQREKGNKDARARLAEVLRNRHRHIWQRIHDLIDRHHALSGRGPKNTHPGYSSLGRAPRFHGR